MRGVDYRMSTLILLALPLASVAQNEAATPAEDQARVLAESFDQLVFGFCAAFVSGDATQKLDRLPPDVTFRGPIALSEAGPLSGPLQARLEAKPESMIYAATTVAAGVGRFQVAYALADGSACVALAQDMPDVVSRISARLDSDTRYKLQAEDEKRRTYVGPTLDGEQSITITVSANPKESAMADVYFRRSL